MKRRAFLIGLLAVSLAEIVALVVFAATAGGAAQDAVAVNAALQSVTRDIDDMSAHVNETRLDYVVIDRDGGVLFRTKNGLSESVNEAITHRDTVLDIERNGDIVARLIVYNDFAGSFAAQRTTAVAVLAALAAVQCCLCAGYALYLYFIVVKPFRKLKSFAERVAVGELDLPLEMDRANIFGAFTESFDIMRSELKKARLAEAKANADKKELVAKLSHDVRTPVASIKAVAEVGLAVAKNKKDKDSYSKIIGKAEQINTLVTDLFNATLEELRQLNVAPVYIESGRIAGMLKNADYMRRATIPEVPECLVYADALRLQQVFDNIFANSYKYAGTDITVEVKPTDGALAVVVEDCGGGVAADELPTLKEKFRRGSNAVGIDGAGLGLYISERFMSEMKGDLIVENGEHGLRVTVSVALDAEN